MGTLLHDEDDYAGAYEQYTQVDPYELDFRNTTNIISGADMRPT